MKQTMTRKTPQVRRSAKPLLEKILTTTDFSPESIAGVKYAAALAKQFGAAITLVYIVEPAPPMSGMEAVVRSRSDSEVAAMARAKLEALAKKELRGVAHVSCCVNIGKPFKKIVEIARKSSTDVIIIATHGHTGVKHVVMGSTAENVVRSAACPVITVPTKLANQPFQLDKILVPIDFSKLSRDALPYAALLVGASSAELVLLSVVEKFPLDYLLGAQITHQAMVPMRQQAKAQLEGIASDLKKATAGLKIKVAVGEGKPFEQICHAARAQTADLIILTTHGFTGLKRLWLGSTAERVVRHAACPVLVVRELKHDSRG